MIHKIFQDNKINCLKSALYGNLFFYISSVIYQNTLNVSEVSLYKFLFILHSFVTIFTQTFFYHSFYILFHYKTWLCGSILWNLTFFENSTKSVFPGGQRPEYSRLGCRKSEDWICAEGPAWARCLCCRLLRWLEDKCVVGNN